MFAVGAPPLVSNQSTARFDSVALPSVLNDASPTPVLAPSITLSVTSGKPGTPVKISGSGFPPGEIVALYVDLADPYIGSSPPGPRADAQGKIQDSFLWPDQKYDAHHRVDPSKTRPHLVCGDTAYPR